MDPHKTSSTNFITLVLGLILTVVGGFAAFYGAQLDPKQEVAPPFAGPWLLFAPAVFFLGVTLALQNLFSARRVNLIVGAALACLGALCVLDLVIRQPFRSHYPPYGPIQNPEFILGPGLGWLEGLGLAVIVWGLMLVQLALPRRSIRPPALLTGIVLLAIALFQGVGIFLGVFAASRFFWPPLHEFGALEQLAVYEMVFGIVGLTGLVLTLVGLAIWLATRHPAPGVPGHLPGVPGHLT